MIFFRIERLKVKPINFFKQGIAVYFKINLLFLLVAVLTSRGAY